MPTEKSYLDQELLEVAVGIVTNGDDVPREVKDRVHMAISLDNRSHLIQMNGRMDVVENHWLHKLTPKRIIAILSGFLTLSAVYIEGTRTVIVDILKAVLGIE